MDKKPSGFKARWKARYHHASIQLILSIAFTAVAVIGMLFLGMALLLRFSSSANEMAAESSQRVLAQVNWNLDSYLRNMMRVSDTVYYRVIKSADLEQSDTAQELRDALKLLYAKDRDVLVSLAVFDGNGELISATPLTELKNSVTPSREGWFTAAMERIENLHFSTPHVQHLFEDPDARYHWVVSLSRHVELTRGGVIQSGVLLVDMNFSGIEQICKDVSFFDGQGYLYLIDGNGEIIYHPRQQLLYAGLQEENNLTAAGYADGTHTEIFQSQLLLCKQAAKNFHTICKKETALKRVLSNLLSAVSLLRFKAVFSCGFRVPPGSGLYQSCAAGSVCIPAGQKYCSPRPRKSCPADRKTLGLPSRCIGHRW